MISNRVNKADDKSLFGRKQSVKIPALESEGVY